jgi:hypothetical protein
VSKCSVFSKTILKTLEKRMINTPIPPYDKGMKNKKGLVFGLRNGGSLLWVRDMERILQ